MTHPCPHCSEDLILTVTIIGSRLNCTYCGAFLSVGRDAATTEPVLYVHCSWCDEPTIKSATGPISMYCNYSHKRLFRYWNWAKIGKSKPVPNSLLHPVRVFDIIAPVKPS